MPSKNRPLENIVHRTESRPFSLHHTLVASEEPCALYLHCHPEAELFFLEQGEIVFYVEDRSFVLKGGDAIFIPPGLIHHAQKCDGVNTPCSYSALVCSTDMLENLLPPYYHSYFLPLHLQEMEYIYPIFAANPAHSKLLSLLPPLFQYREMRLETCELALSGTLLICWQELYNLCFSRLTVPAVPEASIQALRRCLNYILENFSERLSLPFLAQLAGFSQGYFCRCFKELTGYAPFAYLNRIRITKSCELLVQTDKKITEIASLCGFDNISYFNRTFQKQTGTTPTAYRRTGRFSS